MQAKSSSAATVTTWLSYFSGLGVSLGAGFEWINQNSAACGVLIAFMTFLINAYYQRKNHLVICQTHDRRRR